MASSTRRCAGFRPSRTSGSARPMITLDNRRLPNRSITSAQRPAPASARHRTRRGITPTPGSTAPLSPPATRPPPLLDQVRHACRLRHFNNRTKEAYLHGIRRFIDSFTASAAGSGAAKAGGARARSRKEQRSRIVAAAGRHGAERPKGVTRRRLSSAEREMRRAESCGVADAGCGIDAGCRLRRAVPAFCVPHSAFRTPHPFANPHPAFRTIPHAALIQPALVSSSSSSPS